MQIKLTKTGDYTYVATTNLTYVGDGFCEGKKSHVFIEETKIGLIIKCYDKQFIVSKICRDGQNNNYDDFFGDYNEKEYHYDVKTSHNYWYGVDSLKKAELADRKEKMEKINVMRIAHFFWEF